jgi:hypothetical protein
MNDEVKAKGNCFHFIVPTSSFPNDAPRRLESYRGALSSAARGVRSARVRNDVEQFLLLVPAKASDADLRKCLTPNRRRTRRSRTPLSVRTRVALRRRATSHGARRRDDVQSSRRAARNFS